MKTEDIKNCPCCNNVAVMTKGLVYTMIKCEKCGLNLFDKNEKEDIIIKRWNRRVLP